MPDAFGPLASCTTCFYLAKTLRAEKVKHVLELAMRDEPIPIAPSREALLARVACLLRRTGVEDAEHLIARLERL